MELGHILAYLERNHQTGNTYAAIRGVEASPRSRLVVPTMQRGHQLRSFGGAPVEYISLTDEKAWRNSRGPVVFDSDTVEILLKDAEFLIRKLEFEKRELEEQKKFLEDTTERVLALYREQSDECIELMKIAESYHRPLFLSVLSWIFAKLKVRKAVKP